LTLKGAVYSILFNLVLRPVDKLQLQSGENVPRQATIQTRETHGGDSMGMKYKGRTTIRTAAVCFLASAVFEVFDIIAPVPLLGAMRSGVAAMGYHLVFIAIFFMMGIGLWSGKPWGYGVVMAGTALYSIDKVQMLLARQAFGDYIMQQFTTPTTRDIISMVPREQLLQMMTLAYLAIVLCWWGFALYIHLRRSYFTQKI
jgi:hypothetical protein